MLLRCTKAKETLAALKDTGRKKKEEGTYKRGARGRERGRQVGGRETLSSL